MLKKIVEKLSNPLLFYINDEKYSVFKNFCLIKNAGMLYRISIPKANIGKALEYRFELDKYLKLSYFAITVISYLIFIHIKFSIIGLLFFEVLWICLLGVARLFYSNLYSQYLTKNFGKYEITEFVPPVPKRKIDEYVAIFKSKIIVTFIVIALLCVPALLIQWSIKFNLNSKRNNFDKAIKLSNTYFMFYPKTTKIYDMRAYAKFRNRDYQGALEDYKIVLDLSGKKYTKKDLARLANLLLLEKKLSTPTEAIDVYNEFLTKKNLSTLEASQMLWVKSMFKIENNITETIIQEYEDLLASLNPKDIKNQFYISSDKAYMLYLMKEYASAVSAYNILISYAQSNPKLFEKEIKVLYAERGFAKSRMGDRMGAQADFALSGIDVQELPKYEPSYSNQEFVISY